MMTLLLGPFLLPPFPVLVSIFLLIIDSELNRRSSYFMNDIWNQKEVSKIQIQKRKVRRNFVITLIVFLIVILTFILIVLYYSKSLLSGTCGVTNC